MNNHSVPDRLQNILYISDPRDLKHFYNTRFTRIYFGAEFCACFLPTVKQLLAMLAFAGDHKIGLSLMTPPADNAALHHLEKLCAVLPPRSEVIFNDWGVYALCIDMHMKPVHGRLLYKAIKDPRLAASHQPAAYFRSGSLMAVTQKWLTGLQINRIEIDNLRQGHALQLQSGMVSSLYYPFVPCSLTRHCFFSTGKMQCPPGLTDFPCRGKVLRGKLQGKPVYIAGNVQFYINPGKPVVKSAWNVDRLVYMPRFPQGNTFSADIFFLDWNQPFLRYTQFEWGTDRHDTNLEAIFKSITLPRGAGVLDIGCGNGRHKALLSGTNYEYYGLDISHRAIALCRKKYPGSRFIQGDIITFDGYPEYFNIAIDFGCLHAIAPAKRLQYIQNLARMLKPGGFLLLATWKADQNKLPCYYCYNQLPEWGFNARTLQELAGEHFDMISARTHLIGDKKEFIYFLLKKSFTDSRNSFRI